METVVAHFRPVSIRCRQFSQFKSNSAHEELSSCCSYSCSFYDVVTPKPHLPSKFVPTKYCTTDFVQYAQKLAFSSLECVPCKRRRPQPRSRIIYLDSEYLLYLLTSVTRYRLYSRRNLLGGGLMAPPAFGQDPECSAESFRVKWVSRTFPVVAPWLGDIQ